MGRGHRDGEWSIQDMAKAAGTTSRTLRHYAQMELLPPSRIGANGYRYYDQASLVRLQRILLLRDLGLGLPVIAEVLEGEQQPTDALHTHLELLRQEQGRIRRKIESVHNTLDKMERGERLVAAEVFDGFDHTQYKDEVIERWGEQSYADSDRWWRSLSDAEKQEIQQTQRGIAHDFCRAYEAGLTPDSDEVQAITERHYRWVGMGAQRKPSAGYFAGLGELYVSDDRFRANYEEGDSGTPEFIRDAMVVYAERNLQ